jgi:hypothetical protein
VTEDNTGLDSGVWLPAKAPLPTPRWLVGLAALKNQVHALGGTNPDRTASNAHNAYSPVTNRWSNLAPMSSSRSMVGVATVGEHLYAIGGFRLLSRGREPLGINEMYDPANNSWTTRAPMPTPRGIVGLATLGGKIYAIGGSAAKATVAANEVYDPATDSWSSCAPLKAGRTGIAAAGIGESVFLCGGAGDDETALTTVEAFRPATDDYATVAPLPTARWLAGGAVTHGQIHVLGGYSFALDTPLAANEAYDLRANSWTPEDPIPQGGTGAATTAAARVSLIPGGHVYVLQYVFASNQVRTLEYLTSPFDEKASEKS